MVYVLTAFFIILYGLKFGRVKSLCWLTSITIAIIQGVIVSSPCKIVLISAVMAKYNSRTEVCFYCQFIKLTFYLRNFFQDQIVTFMYSLTLRRYRKKTRTFLQDVEYVRAIRNYRRRRYIYEPLTRNTIEVRRAKFFLQITVDCRYLVVTNRYFNPTKVLRERRNLTANRNNMITDAVICVVLILTSLSFLHNLKVLSSKNNTFRANKMVSAYLERGSASSDRRITLDEQNFKIFFFKLIAFFFDLQFENFPFVQVIKKVTLVGTIQRYSNRQEHDECDKMCVNDAITL